MNDYNLVARQNPWWQRADWEKQDLKIKQFNQAKYQSIPQNVLSLKEAKGAVHLISGPRQTGKSTALKLKIKELIARGINVRAINYLNCDSLASKKEVINIIVEYLNLNNYPQHYLFFDEISSVLDWPYAIKWLVDEGLLQKSTVYLTGSSSVNLRKAGELMPGRRGQGKNVDFLPLSFAQTLAVKKIKVPSVKFTDPNLVSKLKQIDLNFGIHLKQEFHSFLQTGGFIALINDPTNPYLHQIYQTTLASEIIKANKGEKNIKFIIKKLVSSLSSETSYTNIAEEAELGSKNTAISYLQFLTECFFLSEVLFYDLHAKRPILKKNKKFYFTDPYILWLMWGYFTGNGVAFQYLNTQREIMNPDLFIFGENTGPVVENYVIYELSKQQQAVYYYKKSRELDFYLPKKRLGIEVKNKSQITTVDLKPLEYAKQKILVSKTLLAMRNEVLILPAYLFGLVEF